EDNSFGGTYIGYARAEFATTTPSVGTVDWSSPAGLPSSSMSEVSSKPSITLDANGNTCIAWQSFDPATSISKIKFQKKNRNGSDVTGSEHEFVISGAGNLPTAPSLCSYRNSQTRPNDLALVWQTQQGTMLARYENSVWSEPFLYTIQGQSPNIEADFFDGNDPIMVYTMTNGSLYSVMSSAIRQNSVSSTLNANWNMVGIPAQVSNFGVDALYPNRTSNVFAYQGGYVIKTTLENGLGYWLKMPATETKTYLGWPLNTHIVPVAAGWNMIGSLSTSLATNKIHSTPSDIIQSDFTTYSSDGYVSSTTLEPGKGYWVKVSATGDLQLDPTASEIIPPGTLPIEPPPNPEAPGKPTLLEPLNNGTNFPTIVDFNWEEEPYATSYRFQLSTSSQFLSFVVHDSTLAVNSKTVSSLGYSTTYYWRVRAANEYGESEWSSMRQFTTTVPPPQPPPIPTLVSPPNYATNQATSLYLSWNISSGSDKYWLQVSTTSNFSTTVINDSNITTTSRLVPSLQSSTTYHWRVKAINTAGASGWSGSWRFTTQSSDPDPCITYSSYQQMDELTITDSGGNSQTLYMRNRGLALGQKMNKNDKMPPEPPPGLFHAKFKSGRFLENIPAGQGRKVIPLVIKDASYPVTISWNVKSNNFTNYWLKSHGNGKKKHTLMHGQGQVIIDKPKKQDDVIWITAEASIPCPGPTLTRPMYPEQDVITSAKPEQFLLEQNHPNPFNPVTVIRYQLSEDAQVKLSVFNTLGVEVASLVNEFQGAGFKSVTFDASNISSGVYFYRLTARNLSSSDAPRHGAEGTHSGHPSSGSGQGYIDIKKMVIMK
ncbi:MAG: T9SS type A sorting domain-containing protein, partial [Ignavibacteriae bacterium]|nr:T9SS type A sorting domain-containing protein [Ignavibacteriota bacterium]